MHVPFCAHRCGYCDFVTVTGNEDRHGAYVDALLAEFDSQRALLAVPLTTIFVGGGTPTLLGPALLDRLLDGLPAAAEITVEANPETVDDALADVLVRHRARVSLGAQSFGARELAVLERRATPDTVRGAAATLRRAGVANLNLDVLFGIPGETRAALDRDIDEALALEPDHLSCYELEAKPGTRFTFSHGAELERQAELLEDHYERVIERLETAGYRWYETANFCRDDRRCQHNLAIWRGQDYLGIGVGAVSTLGLLRRRNGPRLAPYIEMLARGESPLRLDELLTPEERLHERILLGLRLDEPIEIAPVPGRPRPRGGRPARLARDDGRRRRYPDSHTTRPHGRERRHLEADHRVSDNPSRPLSPRQELLLRLVVEAHITTGQPVGSKSLVQAGLVEASPSTVRAELAELEDRGMLDHPHTSAGRVPTEAGYRRYATELVRIGVPAEPFPVDLSTARHELDTALRATTEALASMTQLLAAVSAPSLGTTEVRHVELLRLQPNVVMAVVITATGGVAKRLFVFDGPVDSGLVDWATTYLAETVTGLRLGARQLASRLVDSSLGKSEREFLETLAPVFTELTDDGPGGLILGGTASLLAELRRRDVETIRDVVAALEERIDLLALLRGALDGERLTVRVGDDLSAPALRPLALVTASYGLANRPLGTVSVLGPTRMDYAVALRSVRAAALALSDFVEELYS